MIVPSVTVHGADAPKIIVLDDKCTNGSYENYVEKTVSTPSGTITIYNVRKTPCEHGISTPHWYDRESGLIETNVGIPIAASAPKTDGIVGLTKCASSPPAVFTYKVSITNSTGYPISIAIASDTGHSDDYYPVDANLSIKLSSSQHIPVKSTVTDDYLLDPAGTDNIITYKTTASNNINLTLGVLSGKVSLQKNVGKEVSHTLSTKCPESSINILSTDHKNVVTDTTSHDYYDSSGNKVGSSSSTTTKCNACGAILHQGGGGGVNDDYSGDLYDSSGNKVGNITEGGDGWSGSGVGSILAGYMNNGNYSSAPASVVAYGNACTKVEYTFCSKHNCYGEHYYCTTHNTVCFDKTCTYNRDIQYAYSGSAYGYNGGNAEIRVGKISISCSDNSCTAYSNFISTIVGKQVTVYLTKHPEQTKYTVYDSADQVISEGLTTANSFTFMSLDEDMTVALEAGKDQQKVTLAQTSYSKTYNQPNFNLNAQVAAA